MSRVEPDTITGRATALRQQHPLNHQIDIVVAGCTIRIRANCATLLEHLENDYQPYGSIEPAEPAIVVDLIEAPELTLDVPLEPQPPAPGKNAVKDEYIDLPDGRLLRKRLTGMVFFFGDGGNLAIGPCGQNRNQILNFINNRYIQHNLADGYLLCHAAGVARNDHGLAMAGVAGAGKSTLALDLLAAGCDYVSNDRLLVRRAADNRLEMLGVPKLPRINPGTILHNPRLHGMLSPGELQRFAAMPTQELWNLEQKYDADVARCFDPGRIRLHAPLTAVVLLNWHHVDTPTTIARIDIAKRPDLLERLIKPLGVHYRVPAGFDHSAYNPQAYIELLGDCPVIEMSGRIDFEQATAACLELL